MTSRDASRLFLEALCKRVILALAEMRVEVEGVSASSALGMGGRGHRGRTWEVPDLQALAVSGFLGWCNSPVLTEVLTKHDK